MDVGAPHTVQEREADSLPEQGRSRTPERTCYYLAGKTLLGDPFSKSNWKIRINELVFDSECERKISLPLTGSFDFYKGIGRDHFQHL